MEVTIELTKEDGMCIAYMASENSSGIEVEGETPEECVGNLVSYLVEAFDNVEDEEYDDEED